MRAIFDNAGFVIPGEDVKVAGVKVGAIDSIDVTDDLKAAVVLDITDTGYQDFRDDASCIVRPQSLIGERFVECELTQARAPGTDPPPALRKIEDGPGEGEHLLTVEHTSKTVDLDLINNIMREPVRQRLSIILTDLGIGVAGRGDDLNDVIRRADPALKEVDEVLKILARQNEVLADLAVDSDTILAPLARERRHVSGAIDNAGEVAQATVERRAALAADIELLPPFLRELHADDGAARRAQRRDDAGAERPRRGGTGHQPHGAGARAVLAGRHPGARVARRDGRDRDAGGEGGAPGDARPAQARGQAQAGRR